jgi:sulfonate transport system substrate-binding protein
MAATSAAMTIVGCEGLPHRNHLCATGQSWPTIGLASRKALRGLRIVSGDLSFARKRERRVDMKRPNAVCLVVSAIGTLLMVGSSGTQRNGFLSDAVAQETKLVRIVTARSVSGVSLWGIGAFAEKHGVRTEIDSASTNAEMQRSLQSGDVHVGSLGYQSPAIMAEQNVTNVKVIAGTFVGGQNLIVRKGVEIRSWKDLEGRRIGMPPGSYVAILFALAARENGLDAAKIDRVNTTSAGPAELQALKSGDLDGLVLWSPVLDRAVVEGYAYYPSCCDVGSTTMYGAGSQILGASSEFLKDRPAVVRFLKAFAEAQEFYAKNPDKAIDVISQYTGVSKAILTEALKHSSWDYRVNVQTAVNIAKQGPTFGFTKTDLSEKMRSYFDLSFLSEATGKPVEQLSVLGR